MVLRRQPAGGFAAQPPVTNLPGAYGLAVADFDKNGSPDLAVTQTSASSVSVLFNQLVRPPDAGTPDAAMSDSGLPVDAAMGDSGLPADAAMGDGSLITDADRPDNSADTGARPSGPAPSSSEDGGCSCNLVGGAGTGNGFLLSMLAVLALRRRARRG